MYGHAPDYAITRIDIILAVVDSTFMLLPGKKVCICLCT